MNFYVPAYIALVVASIGLICAAGASGRLSGARRAASLSRLFDSGLERLRRASDRNAHRRVLSSILLVLVAIATYQTESPKSFLEVLIAFLLGTLTFTTLGLFLGLALPNARAAQGAGVLLWFVMMMIGGAGPPFEVLPSSLVRLGDATPLKHVVLLLQDPWLEDGWNGTEMLIVGGFLAAFALLAVIFARRG